MSNDEILYVPHELTYEELLNIYNAFHQGQYQKVVDFDTAAFSTDNALGARVIQLRAQVELGHAEDVIADVEGEADEPDLAAVKAYALYRAGETADGLREAEKLASSSGENGTVQVLAGTVLQAAGKSEEALALLSKHQGNLEA